MRLLLLSAVFLSMTVEAAAQNTPAVQWKAFATYGAEMYTSSLVANATRTDYKKSPVRFGNPMSQFGVKILPRRAGSRVTVSVVSNKLIHNSSQTYTLPRAGAIYEIYPTLHFDYDQMLRVRQSYPEAVQFRVSVDGAPAETQTLQMSVRPITECLYNVPGATKNSPRKDMAFMYGAYVNEDHPLIDKLLAKATAEDGQPMSFSGYQGDSDEVYAELESIWNLLKRQGFRYSDISATSHTGDDDEWTQHVRLLGDSFRNKQTNCVDGTVLMASIFAKIGLSPFLVCTPSHMYIGVDLDEDEEEPDFILIETTMLADSTFDEAVEAGDENWVEFEDEEDNDPGYVWYYVHEIREMGIQPLRDLEGERIEIADVTTIAPRLAEHAKTSNVQLRITNATSAPVRVANAGGAVVEIKSGESISRVSRAGERWTATIAGQTISAATPQSPVAEWMLTPGGGSFQVNLNQLRQYVNSSDLKSTLNEELAKLSTAPRTATPPPQVLVKMEPGWGIVLGKAVRVFDHRGRKAGKLPSGSHFEILDEDDGDYLTEYEGREVWVSADETYTWDQAYRIFDQDVKDEPTAENYFYRGEHVWLNENPRLYPLALKDFNEAIRRDPQDAYTLWNRAGLLCDMGKIELGLADFQKAESLDPDELPAASSSYHIIADAYAARGDSQMARKYRKAAKKADRDEDNGDVVPFVVLEGDQVAAVDPPAVNPQGAQATPEPATPEPATPDSPPVVTETPPAGADGDAEAASAEPASAESGGMNWVVVLIGAVVVLILVLIVGGIGFAAMAFLFGRAIAKSK